LALGGFAGEAAAGVRLPTPVRGTSDSDVYLIDSAQELLHYHLSGTTWSYTVVDHNVTNFQVLGNSSVVLTLRSDTTLWIFNRPGWPSPSQVDGPGVAQFQALDSMNIFVLGTDGNLWDEVYNYTTRHQVDGSTVAFQLGNPNYTGGYQGVFVLGNDGNLWEEAYYLNTNFYSSRSQIGPSSNVADFYVDYSGTNICDNIWYREGNNSLWDYPCSGGKAFEVDTNVSNFEGTGAGVYVLGTNGTLWSEHWNSGSRTEVDSTVQAFWGMGEYYPNDIVYVLGNDGNLWKETGTYKNRTHVGELSDH
jgi:hypothetical protein